MTSYIVMLLLLKVYLFYREFTKKAQVEIEFFQKQKDKDLHESLVSFITLQVKAAKKVSSLKTL